MRMSREIMGQNRTLEFPGMNQAGIEYAYNIIFVGCASSLNYGIMIHGDRTNGKLTYAVGLYGSLVR